MFLISNKGYYYRLNCLGGSSIIRLQSFCLELEINNKCEEEEKKETPKKKTNKGFPSLCHRSCPRLVESDHTVRTVDPRLWKAVIEVQVYDVTLWY